jgi:hypothetical protein
MSPKDFGKRLLLSSLIELLNKRVHVTNILETAWKKYPVYWKSGIYTLRSRLDTEDAKQEISLL